MGSYASKLFSHHSEPEAKSKSQTAVATCGLEKLKLCTPPITKRKLAADPRSATMGIVRTPIEARDVPQFFIIFVYYYSLLIIIIHRTNPFYIIEACCECVYIFVMLNCLLKL